MFSPYAIQPKRKGLTEDQAKDYLRDLVADSNKVVYTSLINLNGHSHRYSYLAMFIVVNGAIINISYFVAFITGLKCKESLTDYIQIPNGRDLGRFAVNKMQHALYKDVFMKERLEQKWV